MKRPRVSILVPAFEAEDFILETLDSIKNQVYQDFQVLISIDTPRDNTKTIIENWCSVNKSILTKIFYQDKQLGWVKNFNFLIQHCNTKYFVILSHDDLLNRNFLQKTIQILKENPLAVTAFPDFEIFGNIEIIITHNSILGKKLERVFDFLVNYFDAVATKGLINREILSDLKLLPENNFSNFSIETIWNLQMALKGEMIRVPEILYHKRIHNDNVTSIRGKWSREYKIEAWEEHCNDCLKTIFNEGFEQVNLIQLIKATKIRLFQEKKPFYAPEIIQNLTQKERTEMNENFKKNIIELSDTKIRSFILSDVKLEVLKGRFKSGRDHYEKFGHKKLRKLFSKKTINLDDFDEEFYLNANPDVKIAVSKGVHKSGKDHYEKWGHKENRAKNSNPKFYLI